jgi:hypothetical protein
MRRLVQRDTRTLTEFCDCLLTALVIDMVRVSSSRRAGRAPASASPPPASAAGEPACAWCCALRSSMSCAASSCEPPSIAAGRNGGAPLSAQKGRSGTSTAKRSATAASPQRRQLLAHCGPAGRSGCRWLLPTRRKPRATCRRPADARPRPSQRAMGPLRRPGCCVE